jgi:hypothetical protein
MFPAPRRRRPHPPKLPWLGQPTRFVFFKQHLLELTNETALTAKA